MGGLVGTSGENTIISNCYVSGTINAASDEAGGLAGRNYGLIEDCQAEVELISDGGRAGGLVGSNSGEIYKSFAIGDVQGYDRIVGLVGINTGEIINCYARGDVDGNSGVGGLVGNSSNQGTIIKNSYAVGSVIGTEGEVGGLVGRNVYGAQVQTSYYYQDPDNGLGIKVSQEEMKQQETYQDWDFNDIWLIDEDSSFPYLQCE